MEIKRTREEEIKENLTLERKCLKYLEDEGATRKTKRRARVPTN